MLRICLQLPRAGAVEAHSCIQVLSNQGLPAVKLTGGSPQSSRRGDSQAPDHVLCGISVTHGSAPSQSSAASKAPTPPTRCLVYSELQTHPYPQWELREQVLSRHCEATQLRGGRAQADSQTASFSFYPHPLPSTRKGELLRPHRFAY